MHHEQDMRKMGGVWEQGADHLRRDVDRHARAGRHRRPFIWARLGFAGFYSKDAIIEAAYAARQPTVGYYRLLAGRRSPPV